MIELISLITIAVVSYLGAIFSSYFSASVMRETGATQASGVRSHCDTCGVQLTWWQLVPLFSFVFQRGRCVKCNARIPTRIFLAEVLGTILFGVFGVFLADGLFGANIPSLNFFVVAAAFFVACLFFLYLAIHDLFTMSIPTKVTTWFVGYAIAVNVIILTLNLLFDNSFGEFVLGTPHNLLAAVGAGLFVFLLIKFTNEKGIGEGDLYLAVVFGAMLGWPGVISGFYALIISSSMIGLMYAYTQKRFKGLQVPLVPFIAFGFVVGITWGEMIFRTLFLQF